jgi:hypothetical protein
MPMSGRWRPEFEANRGYVLSLSCSANHLRVITKRYQYFRWLIRNTGKTAGTDALFSCAGSGKSDSSYV